MTKSISSDGQTPMAANLPMGSNKITSLAAGTLASDAVRFDQLTPLAVSATLAASGGSNLIGFLQAGTGAVARTSQSKVREQVSVVDFGADPTGVADSYAAITAAIASFGVIAGTLIFPKGIYLVSAPIVIPATLSGMAIRGESPNYTYIKTAAATTFDLLRIEASYCSVMNLLFRPGGNQYCMRIYAAHCTVENNRFLSSASGVGTAIFATDTNPDTTAFVSGAYTHRFENNVIGVSGFDFAIGIDCSSASGMQAMVFMRNQILSPRCINMPKGGANSYISNLFQAASAGVGTGIDLGDAAIAEKIYGNYFENFAQGILLRNLSNTSQTAHAIGNHFDNCSALLSTLGTINYIFENAGGTLTSRSWVDNYSSATRRRWLTPSGVEGFNLDSTGIFQVGTTSLTNHGFNAIGAVEGAVIFTLQGAGTSSAFVRYTSGTAANGARTAISCKADSTTSRGINSGGTGNFSGTDYAEYMIRAPLCGLLLKGQIAGIDSNGELTDKWAEAVAFMVKSTNPSIVGGDNWGQHLGERPELTDDPSQELLQAIAAYDEAHEVARARVDRMAYCGRTPVNVYGATPGDYIIPVQDGDGISGIAVSKKDCTEYQYREAVGKVIAIEQNGRARILVKVL